jgi:glutamate-1-semialdehyde aminotransferase
LRSENIVTGFRIDMGGTQKKFGVKPDLACFGKAISEGPLTGSGFNICASQDAENTIHETLTKMDTAAAKVAAAFTSNDPQSFLGGDMIEPVIQVHKD